MEVPLCVDLDGTLLSTDLTMESALHLLKINPLWLFAFPFWLARGRPALKREIASRISLDPTALPMRADFLAWLAGEKKSGRRLILATASDEILAKAAVNPCGLFSEVLGSDGRLNLKGEAKARRLVERFGERGFDYAGDSRADLPVWRRARAAVLVGAVAGTAAAVRDLCPVERIFASAPRRWRHALAALRPHQWAKNLILFIPLATSHRIFEPTLLLKTALAAAAFSLCASSVYVLNDLFDLDSDRRHPSKRSRPLASGALPLTWAPGLVLALLGAAACLASLLPGSFAAVLGAYYALTLAYTLRLRSLVIVDVFALSLLYLLRLLAGHAASAVAYSPWLSAFCLFLFLSLALMKRFSEFRQEPGGSAVGAGRGYVAGDAPVLKEMGIASGYSAALVLAFYIHSEQVVTLYAHPLRLWPICLVVLFAISRLWLVAHRGAMDEDPVRYVLKDRMSGALAVLVALIMFAAHRPG